MLPNKVAIITGAGRGIGAATAKRFAAEGAAVALCARSADQLQATADAITQSGGQVLTITGDVSHAATIDQLFAATLDRWGKLDILVNNAATIVVRPFIEIDSATWD